MTVIKEVFREPWRTGQPGRPPLIPWPRLHIAPVVRRYVGGTLEGIERRLVHGRAEMIDTLRHRAAGAGVLNTAFIERFNGTLRGHIAALGRRTRALAGRGLSLHWALYLTGTVYNFCCEHASWRRPGLIGGHIGWGRTPAMTAGLTDHCWTMEELLNSHVPPPPWTPPKSRGRPSQALKALSVRWAS